MIYFMLQIVVFVVRSFLAATLIVAATAKFVNLDSFATTLVKLGIPSRFTRVVAFTIPAFEAILGFITISSLLMYLVNVLLLSLMSCFSIITFIALRKAPHTTCQCFGALSETQFNWQSLLRNLFLTGLAFIVFWFSKDIPYIPFQKYFSVIMLITAGYILFSLVVAQAVTVIAIIKAKDAS